MSKLTPITLARFGTKAWKRPDGFGFAAAMHAVPAVTAELGKLVGMVPLAFVAADSRLALVALLSLRAGTNLLVGPDGRWRGGYVPAALRGHPFRLARARDSADSLLVIDEDSGAVTDLGLGEPFFDAAGGLSDPLRRVVDFLTAVEGNRLTTQAMVDRLQAAGLIQPWTLEASLAGAPVVAEGLLRVDEQALNGLSDSAWLELRRAGCLPLVYAQLLSMDRVEDLVSTGMREPLRNDRETGAGLINAAAMGLNLRDGDTLSLDW